MRRDLSSTSVQEFGEPVDSEAQDGQNPKDEESRSLVGRPRQQDLVSLIAQLEEVAQGPSLHRNQAAASIHSIMTETDRERQRKQSFADKAIKIAGDTVQNCEFCSVGFACKKGLKPESPNQDSFLIVRVDGRYCIYGVFDGHGSQGHEVSNFVKDQLTKVLVMQPDLESNTVNALETAFRITQTLVEEATEIRSINAMNSGCTATVVFHNLVTNVLSVAHVGDSRAVLGTQLLDSGQWNARDLTEDHKPNLPAERSRIERAGGQVLFDGHSNYRVYVRGKRYPGLNMSRAMGDLLGFWYAGISAHPDVEAVEVTVAPAAEQAAAAAVATSAASRERVGESSDSLISVAPQSSETAATVARTASFISSSASVSSYPLDASDRLMLICSDGIWDFLPSQEAVEIAGSFAPEDSMKAAGELARVAWERWMEYSKGSVVDDITSLVVRFDHHARPPTAPAAPPAPAGAATGAVAGTPLAERSPG